MTKVDNEMTDAELLAELIRRRDQDAFASLIKRYERLVWSVCLRVLRNRQDAEDAFQSTFLLLATKAAKIRKPESLSNWLYSTAWKVSSRIRQRRATQSLDVYLSDGNEVADASASQLELIARQYEIDLVDRHLRSMQEQHRTPLILFYFAGLTAKQIANQLNLTVAATEGRLRRARARLLAAMQADGVHYSPLLFASLLKCNFELQPQLVLVTAERCVTTCAGYVAGTSIGTVSSGAKLMICKGLCAASMSALLAVGGWMHSATPEVSEVQVVDASFMTAAGDEAPQLSAAATEIHADTTGLCSSEDGFCCPLQAGCNALHAHFAQIKDTFVANASKLHGLLD